MRRALVIGMSFVAVVSCVSFGGEDSTSTPDGGGPAPPVDAAPDALDAGGGGPDGSLGDGGNFDAGDASDAGALCAPSFFCDDFERPDPPTAGWQVDTSGPSLLSITTTNETDRSLRAAVTSAVTASHRHALARTIVDPKQVASTPFEIEWSFYIGTRPVNDLEIVNVTFTGTPQERSIVFGIGPQSDFLYEENGSRNQAPAGLASGTWYRLRLVVTSTDAKLIVGAATEHVTVLHGAIDKPNKVRIGVTRTLNQGAASTFSFDDVLMPK